MRKVGWGAIDCTGVKVIEGSRGYTRVIEGLAVGAEDERDGELMHWEKWKWKEIEIRWD